MFRHDVRHSGSFYGFPLDPPRNLLVHVQNDSVFLQWDPVDNAICYEVYSIPRAYDDSEAINVGAVTGTTWSAPIPAFQEERFYHVIASDTPDPMVNER
jgi:hypothetical protein